MPIARLTLIATALALIVPPTPASALIEVGADDQRISTTGVDGDAARDAFSPAIAYNAVDDRYLVCWQSDHFNNDEFEILCDILTASGGSLLGGALVSFFGPAGNISYDATDTAVAYNSVDDEYLVCWSGDTNTDGQVDNEFEIFCRRLDSSGSVTGSMVRVSEMGGLGDAADDAYRPSIAWNFRSNNYLVCWEGDQGIPFVSADDEFEISCHLLDHQAGQVGSRIQMSSAGPSDDPDYDATGVRVVYGSTLLTSNEYLVCWEADGNSGGQVEGETEIFCRRASGTDGTTIGSAVRMTHQGPDGSALYDAFGASVAFDPFRSRYLVCWSGDDLLRDDANEVECGEWDRILAPTAPAVRVSSVGAFSDSTRDATGATATWGGEGRWGVCWQGDDAADQAYEIDCALMTASLAPDPAVLRVSTMGNLAIDATWAGFAPAVARSSSSPEWMVVWYGDDQRGTLVDGENEIYGQRVDVLTIFADDFETGSTANWSSVTP